MVIPPDSDLFLHVLRRNRIVVIVKMKMAVQPYLSEAPLKQGELLFGYGLQGRTFDNVSKAFRLTIKDGEKFSDGKPVASVASLFAHLGLNIGDYLL